MRHEWENYAAPPPESENVAVFGATEAQGPSIAPKYEDPLLKPNRTCEDLDPSPFHTLRDLNFVRLELRAYRA